MEKNLQQYGPFLARLFISQIFLLSAFGKITDFGGTAGYMASKGMPMTSVLLAGAIVFLVVGGASVLAGFKARIGSVLLMVFLVLATYFFHDFWNIDPESGEFRTQLIQFQKNLAIFGGLLYVLAFGSGSLSVDATLAKNRES